MARGFQPDSAWSWAASSGAVTPGQVWAACCTSASYAVGTVPGRNPLAAATSVEAPAALGPPRISTSKTTNMTGTATTVASSQRSVGDWSAADPASAAAAISAP